MTSLRASCEAVLRANDKGRYTIPSPKLYPHQWAWDSAFAAVGWAHIDPARAWLELETLLAGQWEDGRVPHIQFHVLSDDYFPGPDFWRTERSSSISQPPVWASCARLVAEISGDVEPARGLLAKLEASHQFFREQRDPKGWGLVSVAHPWESGLDNCPAWDAPMSRVDVSRPPSFRRKDKQATGDPSVRPTDDDYLRYACLVAAIADDDFGHGPFAVYDPLMSAILARAEDDLAWLAAQLNQASAASDRAAETRRALESHLWDGARFGYYDARAEEPIHSDVIGCYMPLWCGVRRSIADTLLAGLSQRYAASWPLPSCAPCDPSFDARRYWRGPSWININWMLCQSMAGDAADALARQTVELVAQHGFREYFNPHTGEGLGAEQFSWTAALVLDLLVRQRTAA